MAHTRSLGEGNGNPLQYSCLENSMDGGAWWAAVHGVTKSRTQLSDFTFFLSIVSFGEGNGNPLQSSCLESRMDGEAWGAAVSGVAKCQTLLSNEHIHPTPRGFSLGSSWALTSCGTASIALYCTPFSSVSSIRLSASKGHLPGAGTMRRGDRQ